MNGWMQEKCGQTHENERKVTTRLRREWARKVVVAQDESVVVAIAIAIAAAQTQRETNRAVKEIPFSKWNPFLARVRVKAQKQKLGALTFAPKTSNSEPNERADSKK